MGVYIGIFERRNGNGIFFNFKPLAEVAESQITILSPEEQKEILPESENRDILFSCSRQKDSEVFAQMEAITENKSLVIFEFELEDLEDNLKDNKTRNQTGYKVQASKMLEMNKLRLHLCEENIYHIIKSHQLGSDFYEKQFVDIDAPYVQEGDFVFIELEHFWAGPYKVGHRDVMALQYGGNLKYVKHNLREKDYIADGYRQNDVMLRKIDGLVVGDWNDDIKNWDREHFEYTILVPKKDAIKAQMSLQMEEQEALQCNKESLELADGLAEYREVAHILKRTEDYQKAVTELERTKQLLQSDKNKIETAFQVFFNQQYEKMMGLAFDGVLSSKMLHAAAQWETKEDALNQEELVDCINSLSLSEKSPEELIEYLCKTIQIVRPSYSHNTIVNIAICITQGFLTVFSGEPGCGKTSICNIFGEVLGLNKIPDYIQGVQGSKEIFRRYVPVSVERGWTSKRDFVGYFNPLSKTFDKSNRRVYDALHQLDTEKRTGINKLPYVILLDEANLSPMEYYWSDFMNICDDLNAQSEVNLGEDYVFSIPQTLHFLATINNDHTTEVLSPRLVDRAWIISLQEQDSLELGSDEIPSEQIEIISWDSLCNAFIPQNDRCIPFHQVQEVYGAVVEKLKEKRFFVSPRINKSIQRYWVVASKYFEIDNEETRPEMIALDYAIAQRILPKIAGNGEDFEIWLKEFSCLCNSCELHISAQILEEIIARGNQQMKYYQFFY